MISFRQFGGDQRQGLGRHLEIIESDYRDVELARQRPRYLFLRGQIHAAQDFSQFQRVWQFIPCQAQPFHLLFLIGERLVQLIGRDDALIDQNVAEPTVGFRQPARDQGLEIIGIMDDLRIHGTLRDRGASMGAASLCRPDGHSTHVKTPTHYNKT